MSAWVVEREHIDVMLRYGIGAQHGVTWRGDDGEWRELRGDNLNEVGLMLAQENVASVCARYEDDTAEMYEEILEYGFRDPHYVLTPREALKAVACYEYQSCEHDGWESSEAKRFCESLTKHAIDELYEGPWSWDAEALKAARMRGAAMA